MHPPQRKSLPERPKSMSDVIRISSDNGESEHPVKSTTTDRNKEPSPTKTSAVPPRLSSIFRQKITEITQSTSTEQVSVEVCEESIPQADSRIPVECTIAKPGENINALNSDKFYRATRNSRVKTRLLEFQFVYNSWP